MHIIEWRSLFNFLCTTCAESSLLWSLSLSIQEKLAFEEAVKHGIINLADVLEKNEIMKNKEILEQHEQFCKIWQACFTDKWFYGFLCKNRWAGSKTYYVDENNICLRNGYDISRHSKTKMGKPQ